MNPLNRRFNPFEPFSNRVSTQAVSLPYGIPTNNCFAKLTNIGIQRGAVNNRRDLVEVSRVVTMQLEDPEDYHELSELIKGFSSDTRLALLIGFYHSYSANEIADFLDMTRGGLQNNITKMIEADIVYRPQADNQPTYRLTPIGESLAQIINERGSKLRQALEILREEELELREEFEKQRDSPLGGALSDHDIEKLVRTQKWENAWDKIEAVLEQAEPYPGSDVEGSMTVEEGRNEGPSPEETEESTERAGYGSPADEEILKDLLNNEESGENQE